MARLAFLWHRRFLCGGIGLESPLSLGVYPSSALSSIAPASGVLLLSDEDADNTALADITSLAQLKISLAQKSVLTAKAYRQTTLGITLARIRQAC